MSNLIKYISKPNIIQFEPIKTEPHHINSEKEAVVDYLLFEFNNQSNQSSQSNQSNEDTKTPNSYNDIINNPRILIIEERNDFKISLSNTQINESIVNSVSQLNKNEEAIFSLEKHSFSDLILKRIQLKRLNSTEKPSYLVFIYLKLKSVQVKTKSKYEMTRKERFDFASQLKSEGVCFFKEKQYLEAYNKFDQACEYVFYNIITGYNDDNISNDNEFSSFQISILLNLSNSAYHIKKYEISILKSTFIIENLSKTNPKAYYYRALSYIESSTDETSLIKAREDLERLKELISPTDEGVVLLELTIKSKKEKLENSQKSFFKSLFKRSIYDEIKENTKKIPDLVNEHNPKVYFNIVSKTILNDKEEEVHSRIEIELFADVVPKTTENFLLLTTTNQYKNTIFHKVSKDFYMIGGDNENFNGTGGRSIYGNSFEDENFIYNHDVPGLLSMKSESQNSNQSQFMITFQKCPQFNQKNVVFGRIILGFEGLKRLCSCVIVDENDTPVYPIRVVECGRLN